MLMNYKQFNESFEMERIDESKISDITKNVLNKSRELSSKTKESIKKIARIGKREARQTTMALDIISKKILKGRKISEDERVFLISQGKDIARLLPLIAISGIPLPIPITPFLVAYGRKIGIDLIPRDNAEPKDFKDKNYNPVTAIKNKRALVEGSNLAAEFDQNFEDVDVIHKFTMEELKSDIEDFDDFDEAAEWLEDGENL